MSENHLNFLTMLGSFVSITQNGDSLKGTNHSLYLKHLMNKDVQGSFPINLMVNEDDTDYVSLFDLKTIDLLCFKCSNW